AAVSVLAAIAAQVDPPSPDMTGIAAEDALIIPILDARRGQIFGAVYRRLAAEAGRLYLNGEEVVMTAEEFLELVAAQAQARSAPLIFASPTPVVIEGA